MHKYRYHVAIISVALLVAFAPFLVEHLNLAHDDMMLIQHGSSLGWLTVVITLCVM